MLSGTKRCREDDAHLLRKRPKFQYDVAVDLVTEEDDDDVADDDVDLVMKDEYDVAEEQDDAVVEDVVAKKEDNVVGKADVAVDDADLVVKDEPENVVAKDEAENVVAKAKYVGRKNIKKEMAEFLLPGLGDSDDEDWWYPEYDPDEEEEDEGYISDALIFDLYTTSHHLVLIEEKKPGDIFDEDWGERDNLDYSEGWPPPEYYRKKLDEVGKEPPTELNIPGGQPMSPPGGGGGLNTMSPVVG